ncbi:hypothetical protein JOM49_006434 [Amycolatopsis magusensis]|uniref:Uncharacterized protein n=1 Tax=Amycolatopsis magusensis TaxID=882444 RepID=A0ABS4PZQ3_9PSEU|nr:hypothetical protein [Amycolatopsis magusensis]
MYNCSNVELGYPSAGFSYSNVELGCLNVKLGCLSVRFSRLNVKLGCLNVGFGLVFQVGQDGQYSAVVVF